MKIKLIIVIRCIYNVRGAVAQYRQRATERHGTNIDTVALHTSGRLAATERNHGPRPGANPGLLNKRD